MTSTNSISNQTYKFSNSSNTNKFNLSSNQLEIIADNTILGNTILSPSGITNSLTGQTAPFSNISLLPLLQTALYAVNQPPDQQSLAVNSKLYLENANPPTAPTKTITIDASNLLIDYESDTNQDLILQSSSSGSLKYIQTGAGATTQQLVLNPTQVILQDTSSTKNMNLGIDQLYMYNGSVSGTLTATNYSGTSATATTATNATNATNIGITSDNTNGTYFIPFSKTSGTGNKALFQDDTTGPLSYNPSTSTLSATKFVGDVSGNTITCSTLNYTTLNPPITITTPTLSQVMTAGNKASTTLDMSGNNITNCGTINTNIINTPTTNNTGLQIEQNGVGS